MFTRRFGLSLVLVALCSAAAAADVVLERKFADGTKFKSREVVKTRQTLLLSGNDLGTEGNTEVVSQSTYGQRTAGGNLTIATKIESIKSDLKLPGGVSVQFDSAKPAAKPDNPVAQFVVDALQKTAGATISYHLDGENRVQSVEGVPEGGLQHDPDDMKEEFQQSIDLLPKKPLKPGDTWQSEVKQDLGQGQIFTFQRKFEYVGQVAAFATVKGGKQLDKVVAADTSVNYSTREGTGAFKVTKSELSVESSEHTYLFDREAGRIVNTQSKLHVKGPIGLSVANMDLSGDLDLTMEVSSEEVP